MIVDQISLILDAKNKINIENYTFEWNSIIQNEAS